MNVRENGRLAIYIKSAKQKHSRRWIMPLNMFWGILVGFPNNLAFVVADSVPV